MFFELGNMTLVWDVYESRYLETEFACFRPVSDFLRFFPCEWDIHEFSTFLILVNFEIL